MRAKTVYAALLPFLFATLPLSADWLDIPYVRQSKEGCGAAAVAMVIQYWARQIPALDAAAAASERIDEALPASPSRGIEGKAMKRYLEGRGFDVFIVSAGLEDLDHHLKMGRPVIACLGLKGPRAPLHYAVVAGMDERSVWLNDPARGKLVREGLADFRKAWKVTENWALLAVPRSIR